MLQTFIGSSQPRPTPISGVGSFPSPGWNPQVISSSITMVPDSGTMMLDTLQGSKPSLRISTLQAAMVAALPTVRPPLASDATIPDSYDGGESLDATILDSYDDRESPIPSSALRGLISLSVPREALVGPSSQDTVVDLSSSLPDPAATTTPVVTRKPVPLGHHPRYASSLTTIDQPEPPEAPSPDRTRQRVQELAGEWQEVMRRQGDRKAEQVRIRAIVRQEGLTTPFNTILRATAMAARATTTASLTPHLDANPPPGTTTRTRTELRRSERA